MSELWQLKKTVRFVKFIRIAFFNIFLIFDICFQLLLIRLKMDGYALGRTKVFLKYFHLEYLSKLYEKQMRKIIHVQVLSYYWCDYINS